MEGTPHPQASKGKERKGKIKEGKFFEWFYEEIRLVERR
jgi:hypothetical protein